MIFQSKIDEVYKNRLLHRCDDTGLARYFSHEDFEGLNADPYALASSHGHRLQGYFYHYEDYDRSRLVIFDHGFGGGHRSYMKEIEMLCRGGYLVFSYDHTGCMESGGENAGGLSQSLCDLDDCLKALKADASINASDISIIGHSWGGYSTMNISTLHPDVKRIVVLSGFVSVKKMIEQNFPWPLSLYRKGIMRLEMDINSGYVGANGIDALKGTDVRALLIYSANDKMVSRKIHYDSLAAAFSDSDRIELLLLENKGHNPNYTTEAIALLSDYLRKKEELVGEGGELTDEKKNRFRESFDWDKITEQDLVVWQKIYDFLRT